jgi:CHAD domain-containing protein
MASNVRLDTAALRCLQDRLAVHLEDLERHEPGVRTGEDADAVHDMRVAVRRLRSILRTARPLLERQWLEDLREELAWIGDQLGAVRDLDVLSSSLHEQAGRLVAGDAAVAAVLLRPLQDERAQAQGTLDDALSSDRYARIRGVLSAAASGELPVTGKDRTVADLAAREFKRVRKRGAPDPQASNAFLHKRRIRVKRARYAAELAEAAGSGKAVHRFVREAKRFQDLLGAHQDAVVARQQLRRLARLSGRVDAGVVAGRLIQLQEQEIRAAREALPRAWKRLMKRGRKAWRS